VWAVAKGLVEQRLVRHLEINLAVRVGTGSDQTHFEILTGIVECDGRNHCLPNLKVGAQCCENDERSDLPHLTSTAQGIPEGQSPPPQEEVVYNSLRGVEPAIVAAERAAYCEANSKKQYAVKN
jgi:hypothetical protein